MSNQMEREADERGYDVEVVALVDAMNTYPGIRTTESCCGHGEYPFRIWFKARSLAVLPALLYWFDGCHSGFYDWRVVVVTDCTQSPVDFLVEGPIGESAYQEANEIAEMLQFQGTLT